MGEICPIWQSEKRSRNWKQTSLVGFAGDDDVAALALECDLLLEGVLLDLGFGGRGLLVLGPVSLVVVFRGLRWGLRGRSRILLWFLLFGGFLLCNTNKLKRQTGSGDRLTYCRLPWEEQAYVLVLWEGLVRALNRVNEG